MTYVCKVTRKGDGFYQITGVGSIRGCWEEAKSIEKHLERRGEHFEMVSLGVSESPYTKIEVLHRSEVKDAEPLKIQWTPGPFYTPRRLLKGFASD